MIQKYAKLKGKVHTQTHIHAYTLGVGALGRGGAHSFYIGQLLLGIDPALECLIYPVHSAGENGFSF